MDDYELICSVCGQVNTRGVLFCAQCRSDISQISPSRKAILFVDAAGTGSFSVENGGFVGRNGHGAAVLENYPTVSRAHFRADKDKGVWFIEDVSSNGTWVGEVKITPGTAFRVNNGDAVCLSKACRLIVRL